MNDRALGRTGIHIAPLVLGGNVFGWTADEPTSFALLDRFTAAGLNAIDTADVYSAWAPGHQGGESETILGKWMKRSGNRRRVIMITKAGSAVGPYPKDLTARHILAAAEDSLERLQTDYIDLYFAHWPDPATPIEETLRAFETLIKQGKVRAIGASNYDAAGLSAALTASTRSGLPRYDVLQPLYNFHDRDSFEGPLRDLCIREGIGVISYFGLASGFLTGKYRSEADASKSKRGQSAMKYLNPRGLRILKALDAVSGQLSATPSEVALAWVRCQAGITAPIASATSIEQMESLIRAAQLPLSEAQLAALSEASRPDA